MESQARILIPEEIEEVLTFEQAQVPSDAEPWAGLWDARWRREALEHYLALGWSFAIRDEAGQIQGYFLAQPLLFFRGKTQTLWVEHVSFRTNEIRDQLLELAYRWARDKHLQCVLYSEYEKYAEGLKNRNYKKISDVVVEVKSTL